MGNFEIVWVIIYLQKYRPIVLIYLINNIIDNQIYQNYKPIILESLSSEEYKNLVYLYITTFVFILTKTEIGLPTPRSRFY